MNEVPSISITFPDGYEDVLLLERFYGSMDNKISGSEVCHYFGHLANEPNACIAVTGCVGSEDVDFTILSKHSMNSHMFRWTKDGNIEVLHSKVSESTYFLHTNSFEKFLDSSSSQ